MMRYICQVENIQWDTDGATPPSNHTLVTVECDSEEEVDELVSDKLSDDFGFCHKGYDMVIIDRLVETKVVLTMMLSLTNDKQGDPMEWDWSELLDLSPDEEVEVTAI